jgi:hypothetical protein
LRLSRILTWTAVLVLACSAAVAGLEKIPQQYRERVAKQLRLAGENRGELVRAIDACETPQELDAVGFLVANMPYVDLAAMTSENLTEHIRCAIEARHEFPWGEEIPDEIFDNYVLFYRNSQEPLEGWRAYFLDQLRPVVKDAKGAYDAAIAINKWCGSKVVYKPTARRDQGPFETLRSGYGRCEEMVIFAMAAYRAVGIPYRQVWTPWWAAGDDNHAWAEVYIDGRWWYIGSCEPADKLGEAWFNNAAQRAGKVLTLAIDPECDKERRIGRSPYMSPIDITDTYGEVGHVKVIVYDGEERVAECPVSMNVFNYGAFRSLETEETDSDGIAEFTMGDGDFLVVAGTPEQGHSSQVVTIRPDCDLTIIVDLAQPTDDARFWLLYGEKESRIEDTAG